MEGSWGKKKKKDGRVEFDFYVRLSQKTCLRAANLLTKIEKKERIEIAVFKKKCQDC